MTTSSSTRDAALRSSHTSSAARLLALAASPTFALMAWSSAHATSAMALCTSGVGGFSIDGMAAMYMVMCVFHLAPWLRWFGARVDCADGADPILTKDKGEQA